MGIYIDNKGKAQKVANLAVLMSQLLLESGAEVYRVEDTGFRICNSCKGIEDVNVFVTTNMIMVSFLYYNENIMAMRRVKNEGTNLKVVSEINQLSRTFVNSVIHIDVAFKEVEEIRRKTKIESLHKIIGGAFAAGSSTFLFGGNWKESVIAFIIGIISLVFLDKISKLNYSFFIENFSTAFILSFCASFTAALGIVENQNSIIIGALMPLVPGVSITNAVRDLMSGDVLAGISRISIAVFTSAAIAIGVGTALILFIQGGLL